MKKCPKCGRTYSDIVQFCSNCNEYLAAEGATASYSSSYVTYATKGSINGNCYLRGIGGQSYYLTTKLAEGGEGTVYLLQDGVSVAKIYKNDIHEQENKIIYMVKHPFPNRLTGNANGVLSLAWPTDALYDGQGAFVGYVMPKIQGGLEIFEVARGAQSDKVLATWPDYNWLINVEVAKNLAESIGQLHAYGCVVGDMNCKNILVNGDRSITILDCDSFDLRDVANKKHYKCCAATEDYLAPELQGRDLREPNALFTKHTDEFALAVHIFQLLMDNRFPFSGVKFQPPKTSQAVNVRLDNVSKGLCPYLKRNIGIAIPPGAPFLDEMLPDNLIADFAKTFCYDELTSVANAGERTSASTWAKDLAAFFNSEIPGVQLSHCANDEHHIMLLSKGICGFCAAEQRYCQATGTSSSTYSGQGLTGTVVTPPPPPPVTPSQEPPKKKWPWVVAIVAVLFFFFMFTGNSMKLDFLNVNTLDSDYARGSADYFVPGARNYVHMRLEGPANKSTLISVNMYYDGKFNRRYRFDDKWSTGKGSGYYSFVAPYSASTIKLAFFDEENNNIGSIFLQRR